MWFQLSHPSHKCHRNHFLKMNYPQYLLYCFSVLTRCHNHNMLLTGQFPLTFPLSVIIGQSCLKVTLLTRVQSRSAQTRNLWLRLLVPLGRSKVHRKREPRKAAAPGHPPNTGCRTGWSGHAPEQDNFKHKCLFLQFHTDIYWDE